MTPPSPGSPVRHAHRPAAQRRGRPRDPGRDAGRAGRTGLVQVDHGRRGGARPEWPRPRSIPPLGGKNALVVDAVADLFDEHLELPDRGSLQADIEGVVLRFAALLDRPETKTALMAVVAESTRDEALRERIRSAIVERQKGLVLLGRERAQARGELPARRSRPWPPARRTSSST
ncbi:hypothetical protein GCM10020221_26710 [Streptomyces thioluteus]|uniref:Tetracyclin repressor-like C-terminal domain-containing protein n=1 Tax=Streptomyces thioluteus TaxID=66431 RepID=A0ABP6JFJ6_STRTU